MMHRLLLSLTETSSDGVIDHEHEHTKILFLLLLAIYQSPRQDEQISARRLGQCKWKRGLNQPVSPLIRRGKHLVRILSPKIVIEGSIQSTSCTISDLSLNRSKAASLSWSVVISLGPSLLYSASHH